MMMMMMIMDNTNFKSLNYGRIGCTTQYNRSQFHGIGYLSALVLWILTLNASYMKMNEMRAENDSSVKRVT